MPVSCGMGNKCSYAAAAWKNSQTLWPIGHQLSVVAVGRNKVKAFSVYLQGRPESVTVVAKQYTCIEMPDPWCDSAFHFVDDVGNTAAEFFGSQVQGVMHEGNLG